MKSKLYFGWGIYLIIILIFSVYYLPTITLPSKNDLYGVILKEGNKIVLDDVNESSAAIELGGYTNNILYDSEQVIWIPLEYTIKNFKRNPGSSILKIKNGTHVDTIDNLPYFPIKAVKNEKLLAVLCSVDGINGEVAFIDKKSNEVIQVSQLKGNITDAVFDNEYLYVTSDDLLNDGLSHIYKINITNFNVQSGMSTLNWTII